MPFPQLCLRKVNEQWGLGGSVGWGRGVRHLQSRGCPTAEVWVRGELCRAVTEYGDSGDVEGQGQGGVKDKAPVCT